MPPGATQSGNHRPSIKVPATPRVVNTIKAPVHPQKGTQNPAHIHVKIPLNQGDLIKYLVAGWSSG